LYRSLDGTAFDRRVVAAIKWVEGTVIDGVRAVEIKGPATSGGAE
jgi:hypothetical protein